MLNHSLKVWKPFHFTRYLSLSKLPFPILPDSLYSSEIQLTNAKEKSEKILHYHQKLKNICLEGGGEKGKAAHEKKKKILPRDKILSLFDEGSETLELCLQAGLGFEYGDIPGASAICSIGQIHGQYCVVTVNDGTMKGGTFYPITVKKTLRAQEVSQKNLLPKVYLVDSGGAFLPLQSEIFPDKMQGGRGFYNQAVNGARGIPQLALVCGSCTAGGAYVPMMCDDAGIVHKAGSIFLGGPPLVKAATGETISVEDLGGATLHCNVSGCTDYFAETEQEGLEMLRDAFATLDIAPPPSRARQNDPLYDVMDLDIVCGFEDINRSRLLGVISRLVDGSRFREFKPSYGPNLVVGYSLVDQSRVGVVANCGPLTYEDGLKGAHFVQNCSQRNIPLLFLQNSGSRHAYWSSHKSCSSPEEAHHLLRGRAAMITAVSCAQVPKVTINIGGCHGDDNYTMCGPSFHPNFIFSWPGTETTLQCPVEKSSAVEPSGDKESSSTKKKTRRSLSAFDFPLESAWFLASRSLTDGIIAPSETRKVVSQCLRIFEQRNRISCRELVSPVYRF